MRGAQSPRHARHHVPRAHAGVGRGAQGDGLPDDAAQGPDVAPRPRGPAHHGLGRPPPGDQNTCTWRHLHLASPGHVHLLPAAAPLAHAEARDLGGGGGAHQDGAAAEGGVLDLDTAHEPGPN